MLTEAEIDKLQSHLDSHKSMGECKETTAKCKTIREGFKAGESLRTLQDRTDYQTRDTVRKHLLGQCQCDIDESPIQTTYAANRTYRYHCPYCDTAEYKPTQLAKHIRNAHV